MNKGKLIASLIMDAIGMASYITPLAEFLDLPYAPLQAGMIYWLYQDPDWSWVAWGEETMPYTDVIPTATLAWLDYEGILQTGKFLP